MRTAESACRPGTRGTPARTLPARRATTCLSTSTPKTAEQHQFWFYKVQQTQLTYAQHHTEGAIAAITDMILALPKNLVDFATPSVAL